MSVWMADLTLPPAIGAQAKMWVKWKLFFSYTPHPVRQQILPAPPLKFASTGLIPLPVAPWPLCLFFEHQPPNRSPALLPAFCGHTAAIEVLLKQVTHL